MHTHTYFEQPFEIKIIIIITTRRRNVYIGGNFTGCWGRVTAVATTYYYDNYYYYYSTIAAAAVADALDVDRCLCCSYRTAGGIVRAATRTVVRGACAVSVA